MDEIYCRKQDNSRESKGQKRKWHGSGVTKKVAEMVKTPMYEEGKKGTKEREKEGKGKEGKERGETRSDRKGRYIEEEQNCVRRNEGA